MIVDCGPVEAGRHARPFSAADRGQPVRPARDRDRRRTRERNDWVCTGPIALRMSGDDPFVTDGGHFILDASFGRIPDTWRLAEALSAIPGVVEHGLFLGLAQTALIAGKTVSRPL